MPNIGTLLKEEITRLSRKEVRRQMQPATRSSAQYRRHIAALRRQVSTLERKLAQLQRNARPGPPAEANGTGAQKVRFVAKGLKSQRSRLGLSAAEYGRLVGVSAQSVYNWEQGHAVPRAEQLGRIAALRGVGKRAAQARLEELASAQPARRRNGKARA
jgi:DNA-binding XRE family transcriptional regulator